MERTLQQSLVKGASCTSLDDGGCGTAIVPHRGVMSLTILIVDTIELRTFSWKGSTMRTVSWIGVVCLLAGTCAAALAQAPVGTWATAAPLPQPRAEHAVVGLDGKIYAIAGGNSDGRRHQDAAEWRVDARGGI